MSDGEILSQLLLSNFTLDWGKLSWKGCCETIFHGLQSGLLLRLGIAYSRANQAVGGFIRHTRKLGRWWKWGHRYF